jgi:hypothetical protein
MQALHKSSAAACSVLDVACLLLREVDCYWLLAHVILCGPGSPRNKPGSMRGPVSGNQRRRIAEDSGRLGAGLHDGFSGAAQLDMSTAQLGEEVVAHEAAAKAACRSRLSAMGKEQSRVQPMERVRAKRKSGLFIEDKGGDAVSMAAHVG